MTNTALTISPIVTTKDGQVFADSRDVAEFFGKRHADVLRAIDAICKRDAIRGQRNFAHTPFINEQNGETE